MDTYCGKLPAFKRVRHFPTNQRFEPLVTGNTLYVSDAWAVGTLGAPVSKKRVCDHPYWSWTRAHAFNVQTNRMTRLEQVREIFGGHRMRVNDQSLYSKLPTVSALRRSGD